MRRIEAVLFASATPVAREDLARVVEHALDDVPLLHGEGGDLHQEGLHAAAEEEEPEHEENVIGPLGNDVREAPLKEVDDRRSFN